MPELVRRPLMPGVTLSCLQTEKFKTSVISLSLLRPLSKEEASLSALLPTVLCRGTQTYPDMSALSVALESLYGAQLEPAMRKKGEVQCVGFVSHFVDGAFLPGHPNQLSAVSALLGEVLLRPAGDGRGFLPAYVDNERGNLIDQIRAGKNDKRTYAGQRLLELMCEGEAYSIDRLGDEDTAKAVTADRLWTHYQRVLASSQIEILYVGPRPADEAAAALTKALGGLPRGSAFDAAKTEVVRSAGAPRRFEERMEVSQGKLVMGMRMGVSGSDPDYPLALLATGVFGGTTNAKLFMHVRERLQLCYYASAWMEGLKGLLIVSSGIEFKNRQAAEDEIRAQWDAVCRGDISEEELSAARLSLSGMMRAISDKPHRLEDYYLGQQAAGLSTDPDALADRIDAVAKDDVARVARGATWDSIYFLTGEVQS